MAFSLAAPVHHELIVKKSRFIAGVEPVSGREQALARVAQLKAEHPGARHVCWALMAGGQSAAHDDGEPSGTAGRPMLEVLRHQDLQGVLATVVRYFGGIQLGAGGLLRAYTEAVAQALLNADKIPLIQQTRLACSVPYALEGLVRRELERPHTVVQGVAHDQWVTFLFALPEAEAPAFMQALSDRCQGQLVWLDEVPQG